MTPTARSLAVLREMGYTTWIVEQWNGFAKKRYDLFGCIDILAIHPELEVILGVQACTTGDAAKRTTKALAEPMLRTWLEAGGRFEVWGWAKRGPAGKRKLWTLSRRQATLEEGQLEVAALGAEAKRRRAS